MALTEIQLPAPLMSFQRTSRLELLVNWWTGGCLSRRSLNYYAVELWDFVYLMNITTQISLCHTNEQTSRGAQSSLARAAWKEEGQEQELVPELLNGSTRSDSPGARPH